MSRLFTRHAVLPAIFAAALALPAAAEETHHPPADTAKPVETQSSPPAQPRTAQPGMPGMPGGMMMGNMMPGNMMQMMQMMQMMHQMMSGGQDRGAMHRMNMMGMGMMGMGGMGMTMPMQGQMAGNAVENVEGNIAFVKAELKITPAQAKAWDDFAAAMRANAKQLNELRAELAKAGAAEASPVERIDRQEKILAARLEIVRRTKPALGALYAALSDDQKKTFAQLAPRRTGMR